MNEALLKDYNHIRNGGTGFFEQKRGLIAVWGKESVQFLNGLITNDVAKLEDGGQMLAAFPNVQGRLLAIVRVLRQGDRFLFETDEVTREKVFNNLFRFTYAGDFFVEDLSDNYKFIELFGLNSGPPNADGSFTKYPSIDEVGYRFFGLARTEMMVLRHAAGPIRGDLLKISDELYETLRIESGMPKYGVDMDETTVVLETGLDDAVSFTKGCYIGQEIIARIHFRGHVAKQLTGLILSEPGATGFLTDELKTLDGKNAGKITSSTFSPKLGKMIALAFVRYDYLTEGTELFANEQAMKVKHLPIVS